MYKFKVSQSVFETDTFIEISIPAGVYSLPPVFKIEPDASTAAYDATLSALSSEVIIDGLSESSCQGES
jgi:hypothetical protein